MSFTTTATLRILFFVDDDQFLSDWSTSALRHALAGGKFPVLVSVKLRNVVFRLTESELRKYDEVWFFLHTPDGKNALPLGDEERAELHRWMNRGGGVLIAGDHADGKKGQYRGLGAPIGRCVPRARHLRVWSAPPGLTDEDLAADTTEFSTVGRSVDAVDLAQDEVPQRLLLPLVVSAGQSAAQPHAIFRGARERILDLFPDHEHEGKVKVTVEVSPPNDAAKWPTIAREWPLLASGPEPGEAIPGASIIAWGVDWRHGRTHPLMAQWDGHKIPSEEQDCFHGRILADASFHHYVDLNLVRIVEQDDARWRTIGEVFQNQAAWLAPREYRVRYCEMALDWVRKHEEYQEVAGTEGVARGKVARRLLMEVLPGAWYHENIDEMVHRLKLAGKLPISRPDFEALLLEVQLRSVDDTRFIEEVLRSLAMLPTATPGQAEAIQDIVRNTTPEILASTQSASEHLPDI